MKTRFTLFIMLVSCLHMNAQQEAQFTQFMFNKLGYNPAYAGSKEVLTFSSIYRNQWTGLDGAPQSLNAHMHTPFFNNKCGIGLSVLSDRIGMMNTRAIELSYAYRMPMPNNANLSFGLKGQMMHGQTAWDEAITLDSGDDHVPTIEQGQWSPNFGVGAYYSHPKFYVGLSAPELMKNVYYSDRQVSGTSRSSLQTYYLMAGYIAQINPKVAFKPAVLLKYNPNSPFDIDFNASFLFMDMFWVGATYRLGDSVDAVLQYQLSQQLKTGIAFDFTVSELNQYSSGTFEVMLEYQFNYDKAGRNHLRYF